MHAATQKSNIPTTNNLMVIGFAVLFGLSCKAYIGLCFAVLAVGTFVADLRSTILVHFSQQRKGLRSYSGVKLDTDAPCFGCLCREYSNYIASTK